ncbi:hypothetical protein ACFVHW_09665 [Streptomyces sp. NPDC127110]|uniref:hypothetical protein n=1 Tax=Streptomyces sp. NPDC127110 TaxID=3345362 RepID=UPI00362CF792
MPPAPGPGPRADDIPRAERSLLTAYWALSGYGQRASRALGRLLAASRPSSDSPSWPSAAG